MEWAVKKGNRMRIKNTIEQKDGRYGEQENNWEEMESEE